MKQVTCVTCASVLIASCAALGGPRPQEITVPELRRILRAEHWLNPQPASLATVDTHVLVLFDGRPFPGRGAKDLNLVTRWFRNDGVQVVGLTRLDERSARLFIQKSGARFKIGAACPLPKKLNMPYFVLVKDEEIKWQGEAFRTLMKEVKTLTGRSLTQYAQVALMYAETPQEERTRDEFFHLHFGRVMDDVQWCADETLGNKGPERLLSPQDLQPLKELYDEWSHEEWGGERLPHAARETVIDTGYRDLMESGKLSSEAMARVRNDLLEFAGNDPVSHVRARAAQVLRLALKHPEEGILSEIDAVLAGESDPWVEAYLHGARLFADPAVPADVREYHKQRPKGDAVYLRRHLLRSEENPAYQYQQTAGNRSPSELIEDYNNALDSKNDRERENDLVIRLEVMRQFRERADRLDQDVLDTCVKHAAESLGIETDPGIRWEAATLLWETGDLYPARTPEITRILRQNLPGEPAHSITGALMKNALDDWVAE